MFDVKKQTLIPNSSFRVDVEFSEFAELADMGSKKRQSKNVFLFGAELL